MVHDRDHAAFLSVLASKPDLDLYRRVYEGPSFKAYLQHRPGSYARRAALLRFRLRSGTSMLRHHDRKCNRKFKYQPSHDTQGRICPACEQPGQHRVRTARITALPCTRERGTCRLTTGTIATGSSTDFPTALVDDEAVVADEGDSAFCGKLSREEKRRHL